jgi:hypothetical protein
MILREWIWVVLASLAVVMVWLAADRLGNRWWQALPEPIREKGLIRWLIEHRRNPQPETTSRASMNDATKPPPLWARLLCTLCAAFIAGLGLLAIVTETHTGHARFKGQVTLLGDQAVDMGLVLLCTALLPLVVWVPRRWVVWALVAWWLLVMATIVQAVFKPF